MHEMLLFSVSLILCFFFLVQIWFLLITNRPKMAAENSNKLKLKMYTSIRKSTFTLVTLQSFSISGLISAEKCKLKNEKFTDDCMTGGTTYTPSHTNVCKFVKFLLTFPKLI